MKQKFYPVGKRSFSFRAFTLIELLVVIAIVGLLASIVLVSLRSARSKATIATGLQFSQSTLHSLGAYALGLWNLDEGAGPVFLDASGNGNTGICSQASGTCPISNSDTPSGKGISSKFDGADDNITIVNSDTLKSTNTITIEAWIYPEPPHQSSSYGGIICNINGYPYSRLLVHTDGRTLSQVVINGASQNVWGPVVTNNSWNHLVYVYNGSEEVWYMNGKKGTPSSKTGLINTSSYDITIGWGHTNTGYYHFKGSIDDVRIYGEALSAGEIQKHYVEGLERHSLAGN